MAERLGRRFAVPVYRLRLVRERVLHYAVVQCASAHHAAQILHAELDDCDLECVVVVALNGRNVPVAVEMVAMGGLHAPRDVLKTVLLKNASALIVGHNHISGDPAPSYEDIEFTRILKQAAELLGTPLVDHVIVSPNGKHTSMHDLGLLDSAPVRREA